MSISLRAQESPRYNRFQHRKFHWKACYGNKVNIYFPADVADSLFRFVYKQMPDAIEHIKNATIHDIPKNLNVILYPSIDQVYETNIGSYEPVQLTFPTLVYKGKRIVLAYNGSYKDIKMQLYLGLVRAIWESQMKEGNQDEKEDVRSSAKSKLTPRKSIDIPFWYREGSIRYFALGWPIESEDKLRSYFKQNSFNNWQQVLSYAPRLGGQAFCYFLTKHSYETAVAQTFFQLKKKKSLPRAIRLVTKESLDSLYIECFAYYKNRFSVETKDASLSGEKQAFHHKKGIVSSILLNADGNLAAYIALYNGKRIVYIHNFKTLTTKKIASYNLSPWIDEHSADQYPIIEWHKTANQLYVAMPRKGKIVIRRYTNDGEYVESTTLYGVDGITSFNPLSDRYFLLSAYRKGQSDIVSYDDNKGRYIPHTDDEYDDSRPFPTNRANEIMFVSDRPKQYEEQKTYFIGVGYKADTLWQGLYKVNEKELVPVMVDSIGYIKWDKPISLDHERILVTSTKYGSEKNVILSTAGGTTVLNEYQPRQYLLQTKMMSFFSSDKDSIYVVQKPLEEWIQENKASHNDSINAWLTDYMNKMAMHAKEDSLIKRSKDTTHYMMNEIFASKSKKKKKPRRNGAKNKAIRPGFDDIKQYTMQLHRAYFAAKVNNDFFVNRYQPFKASMGQFKFPEISGMVKGGFTDLFENHHFTVAYALPASTEGSTFFVRYENTEKKIDWGLSYFRKVETLKPDPARNWVDENGNKYPQNAKDKIHYYELFLKKPLTYDCSLGLQIAVRQDKTVFLATDKYSLRFPPIESAWSINTLSFNLNKLHPTIPFLNKGYKASALFDLFKGFGNDDVFLFGSSLNLRYDLPIYKYITLVTQMHVGYSGGDQHVLYNFGGEENNVTPRVDTSVHFPQNAPYAFQTLVTPFRGYYQNSLYGNQYALLNMDVYFPIFQTLIPIETPLPFINNLQLGLLNDVATARETWNEQNPGSKWLWSYGLSARTVLAGYPLRLEVAWPGTFRKEPVWYFSLNLQ